VFGQRDQQTLRATQREVVDDLQNDRFISSAVRRGSEEVDLVNRRRPD
jgi:hypothetical protein